MEKGLDSKAASINMDFVNNLNITCLFHLTGGEPFIVPNFMELWDNSGKYQW
jgi:organic radical activating enzyme